MSSTCTAGPDSPRPGTRSSATSRTAPRRRSTGCWRAGLAPAAFPRTSPRSPTAWPTGAGRARAQPAQGLVGLSHALRPRPAGRAAHLMWHNHFATSNLKVDDLGPCAGRTRRSARSAVLRSATCSRDAPRPGPARLARRPRQPQRASQRKPGPRADGALHAGRRPLHRGRRQGGRPGPDRLDGSCRTMTPVRSRRGTTRRTRRSLGRPARSTPTARRLLLEHPATAHRLAWRLCQEFFGEGAIDERRDRCSGRRSASPRPRHRLGGGDDPALASCSSPRRTWAGASSSPVEFVVGAVRALECFDPPPSTLVLADWCGRLGQDLFYPPNVGGWPGGRTWITTRSIIGRANFAAALVEGRVGRPGRRSTCSRWPPDTAKGGSQRSSRNCSRRPRRRMPQTRRRSCRATARASSGLGGLARTPSASTAPWHTLVSATGSAVDLTKYGDSTMLTRRILRRLVPDRAGTDAPRLPGADARAAEPGRTTAFWSSSSSTAATTASTPSSRSRTTATPSIARRIRLPRSG